MRSPRPPRGGVSGAAACRRLEPAALPALLRATHLLGLAFGSALGKLRESSPTAAQMFARSEEQALLLRMTCEARGWKLSARTVGRMRRERWPRPRVPEVVSPAGRAVARHANHVWMADLTDVKGLFGIVTFKVAVVFDAFSRMPLAARMFEKASARQMATFVSGAARRHGRPEHFVSDRGPCFIGRVLRKLRRLGVKLRYGAIGKKGSIALIERLWRTLKDAVRLRWLRPIVAEDLLEKVKMGLVHYAHFRPHQALDGATPAEIYFGRTPAHLSAIRPPRGRPGEGPMDSPFRIEYLDAERLLPVLVRKAA